MDNNFLNNQLLVTYKKNIEALKKYDYELYRLMDSTQLNNRYFYGKPGNEFEYNLYSKEKDILFYDAINPMEKVKQRVDSMDLNSIKSMLLLGFGLGYEMKYLSEEILPKNSCEYIYIVEREAEVFKAALYNFDFSDMFSQDRVKIYVGLSIEDLFLRFREYMSKNNRAVILMKALGVVYNEASFSIDRDYYLSTIEKFKEAGMSMLHLFGNDPDDSLIGIDYMFKNLKNIISNPGINVLYNKFNNMPAVVVASGPSLKKNIHLLKEIKNKAFIICAESTLKALLENGVKPNMVCSFERVLATIDSLGGYKEEDIRNVYLNAVPVIPDKAFEVYKGPKFITYRDVSHFKWLKIDKGTLPVGESTANMAFETSVALGCNPIILVGQDLAFSEDGKTTHIDSAFGGSNQQMYRDDNLIKVKGNNGEDIYTSDLWFRFLKIYERDIANYKGKCINSTEGGAYIYGTEIMPLKDSIQKHIKEDIFPERIIEEAIKEGMVRENYSDNVRKTIEKIEKAIVELESTITVCNDAFLIIDEKEEFLRHSKENLADVSTADKIKISSTSNKVQETIRKFRDNNETFDMILMHVIQSYVVKFQMDMNELPKIIKDTTLLTIESILKIRDYVVVIAKLADITLGLIKETKENLLRELV